VDYRFELAGKPHLSNGDDIVQVRLVHVPDAKPVPDAVVFESAADMGLSGMPTMPGPVVALPPKNGLYLFKIYPGMAGKWALHLAAKAQGQTVGRQSG